MIFKCFILRKDMT